MNIFFIYMLLVSVLISVILIIIMKVNTYKDDKIKLLNFIEEYGYLATRFDIISLYTDLQVKDPNDGVTDQATKWRCIPNPIASGSFVIASKMGYISNTSFDISLTYSSESICIFTLFTEYEAGALNLHPIYNPCISKTTLECQTLLSSLQ